MSTSTQYFFAPFEKDKETLRWMDKHGYTEDRYVEIVSESGKIISNAIAVSVKELKEIVTRLRAGACCYYQGSPDSVRPIPTEDFFAIIS